METSRSASSSPWLRMDSKSTKYAPNPKCVCYCHSRAHPSAVLSPYGSFPDHIKHHPLPQPQPPHPPSQLHLPFSPPPLHRSPCFPPPVRSPPRRSPAPPRSSPLHSQRTWVGVRDRVSGYSTWPDESGYTLCASRTLCWTSTLRAPPSQCRLSQSCGSTESFSRPPPPPPPPPPLPPPPLLLLPLPLCQYQRLVNPPRVYTLFTPRAHTLRSGACLLRSPWASAGWPTQASAAPRCHHYHRHHHYHRLRHPLMPVMLTPITIIVMRMVAVAANLMLMAPLRPRARLHLSRLPCHPFPEHFHPPPLPHYHHPPRHQQQLLHPPLLVKHPLPHY